jgi:hypothetical protein
MGGPARLNWPILWSLPAGATAAGKAEATFAADAYLDPAAKWGYGHTQPRAPRTVLVSPQSSAQVTDAIAPIMADLNQLGVLICDPPGVAQNAWAPGVYLGEATTQTHDTELVYNTYGVQIGTLDDTHDVTVPSPSKYIGGDLLVLYVNSAFGNFGNMQETTPFPGPGPPNGHTPYNEWTNWLTESATQLSAAADPFRSIQVIWLLQPLSTTYPPFGTDYLAAALGSFSKAPAFVTAQALTDNSDATAATAIEAAIRTFFGI